jgi:hypothetical protein
VWRVEVDDIDYVGLKGGFTPEYDMNDYVRRSIVKNTKLDPKQQKKRMSQMGTEDDKEADFSTSASTAAEKKRQRQQANTAHGFDGTGSSTFSPLLYGGLEPYLSTSISSVVSSTLDEVATQPDTSAYLSLHSFTLGSKPPLIRGLRINTNEEGLLEASFDVDFVSTDLEIILKVSCGGGKIR